MSQYKKTRISQLMTVTGVTATSAVTTGATLNADIIQTAVTKIRIPKGLKLKIWGKSAITAVSTDYVSVQYSHDGNSTTPTWVTVDRQATSIGMDSSVAKRRPIVLHGLTGNEAVQILPLVAAGTAASTVIVTYDLEITNE